jgi:hypothetical protein
LQQVSVAIEGWCVQAKNKYARDQANDLVNFFTFLVDNGKDMVKITISMVESTY